AAALAGSVPADAALVQYPYCIIYRDGLRSCGFRNLQECVQVRVGADMCVVNPFYPDPQSRQKRRHR
ncbi:MAG: DUF3551 domain-containing protein, partial [Pseudorhodoplanes sp.]